MLLPPFLPSLHPSFPSSFLSFLFSSIFFSFLILSFVSSSSFCVQLPLFSKQTSLNIYSDPVLGFPEKNMTELQGLKSPAVKQICPRWVLLFGMRNTLINTTFSSYLFVNSYIYMYIWYIHITYMTYIQHLLITSLHAYYYSRAMGYIEEIFHVRSAFKSLTLFLEKKTNKQEFRRILKNDIKQYRTDFY